MENLSTLDACFLEIADSGPHLGYADDLVFGITADCDAAPDVEDDPVRAASSG